MTAECSDCGKPWAPEEPTDDVMHMGALQGGKTNMVAEMMMLGLVCPVCFAKRWWPLLVSVEEDVRTEKTCSEGQEQGQ